MQHAAMTHAANSGEFVHVKAILAHFPHGSTTATMIGVCTFPANVNIQLTSYDGV